MSTAYVRNASELYLAISNAQPGDTIVLKDGDYGSLNLTGVSFSDYVTLKSENPQGAVFESVSLKDTDFVRIDGIHVDSSSNGAAASTLVSVTEGSSNVEFINSEVNGLVDDFYYGHYGLYTKDVSNVTFANNYIHDVKIGGTFYTAENLTVSGNVVDYIASDSFKFISVNGALIEYNMGARHLYPETGEHPDFIQFQGGDSSDIIIRGNVSLPGTIDWAQGIFLDDAHYTNVLIEDNVIVTSMIRGVSVSSGTNVVARDNTLINLEGGASKATKVLVVGESYNNIMVSYASDASVGTNLTLQNQDPNAPLYYGNYFANSDAGRWIQLEDLLPKEGTLAETYGADVELIYINHRDRLSMTSLVGHDERPKP